MQGLEWKPPATLQEGRCKDADIAATKAYLAANPAASNEDFENFVKNRDTRRHDCIFSDADGQLGRPLPCVPARWSPSTSAPATRS